ncbi:PAS domain S-box-containing protein/diguanylate cyclase (GGDEF) domain-containing protein [Ectothiorhodospira magna]|uniref:PAS domain S-box-containing protein/diguanylate cyclase (GGDEF) domain-containing protein n=1 Tax=Ectothiorhodospira magna TaxID=867345 RepID=A0A1H9BYG3_9GAMM|nr:sensor domain-containing diguanylate cyclase [Ectothiorhodospira magna]SEP93952.1 PAS domain S-box-containing protein/diguanylate cyclase (GGDEF) domain-containing protein [Ectothiorhodospira magna]
MALILSDAMLRTAIEQSFNAVVVTTSQLELPGPQIVYVNQAFCNMTGYTAEELMGKTPRILQGPRTDPETIERLRRCLNAGEYFIGNTVNYRKDGECYYVEWNITPIRDGQGRITHFVSVQRDLTEKKKVENDRNLMANALEANSDQVLMTDREGHIVYVNRAFEDQTGYRREEIIGQTPSLLRSGHHDHAFYDEMWHTLASGQPFRATFVNRAKDGSEFHLEQTVTPVRDDFGEITHYMSTGKDISDRVRMEQTLRRMATIDLLTGLPNRSFGEQLLEREWHRQARYQEGLSLIMADIDHFKSINDEHGHDAGDQVLAQVGKQLQALVRRTDSAIRWGGEEFLILVPRANLEQAIELAERIRLGIRCQHHPGVGRVTMSFGVACYQPDDSRKSLLRRADQTLYAAKEAGRDRVMASPDTD